MTRKPTPAEYRVLNYLDKQQTATFGEIQLGAFTSSDTIRYIQYVIGCMLSADMLVCPDTNSPKLYSIDPLCDFKGLGKPLPKLKIR